GDLLADHYVFGQTERVSREAPVLIVRHEHEDVKLGGGANAAANAAALGAKVSALGVLGRDPIGRQMAALFESTGIALHAVNAAVTETRTRVLAGGISTKRQQMLRIDRGSQGSLPPRQRRALASKLLTEGRRADVIMVSDYGAGVLCDETLAALRTLAADGIPVSVDSRFSLLAYAGLTVCKPNEPELNALTGMTTRTDAELVAAARVAQEKLKCQILLVTRGRNGMTLLERGQKPVHIPVHGSDEAVDVTGAGDTVSATFALALGAGGSPFEAARLANIAGSLVVQKEGTATVTRPEIQRELSK
ncbi:MAG: bifunctional heptose 7-phosphate kinase/heptose 1-phosphate adenyltransferase, partial [Archangium sp.]